VQIGMTNKTTPHIDLPIDGGQLRFRRKLEAMIAEERAVDIKMQE
jgi:vanillate O-demethylase monooxygenase subunit